MQGLPLPRVDFEDAPSNSSVAVFVQSTRRAQASYPACLCRVGEAVVKVIMSPETTAPLDLAGEKGCTIVRGKEMLTQQLHLASMHLGLQPQ